MCMRVCVHIQDAVPVLCLGLFSHGSLVFNIMKQCRLRVYEHHSIHSFTSVAKQEIQMMMVNIKFITFFIYTYWKGVDLQVMLYFSE
jgi:hypothetical protein